MRGKYKQSLIGLVVVLAAMFPFQALAQGEQGAPVSVRVLDPMDDPSGWQVVAADGVNLKVKTAAEPGKVGKCLRLDYDFTRGSGYGLIRKRIDLPLGPNYRFSYWFRGAGPRNTIEFKLVDPSGDNVWWVNQREIEFPMDWTPVRLPKRKFVFAWGPSGGKPLDEARWIDIAITSVNGGKGTLLLDELAFESLPEVKPYEGTPALSTTSGHLNNPTLGQAGVVGWSSAAGASGSTPSMTIDFGAVREIGGLVLTWGEARPRELDLEGSTDGVHFETIAHVKSSGKGGESDYVQTPDAEVKVVRIVCADAGSTGHITLDSVRVMPPEFGASKNEMMKAAAADSPRGWYPRYFSGESTYWTLVGVSGDGKKALISEDGAVEVDKLGFSLEPFVLENNTLHTWADASSVASLEEGHLPIPSVRRTWRTEKEGLQLEIKAFGEGDPGTSHLFVRYELKNLSSHPRSGRFAIAIRPFQVNPPYQNLNITGGVAAVHKIEISGGFVRVDQRWVLPMTLPDQFGATTFGEGEIVRHIGANDSVAAQTVDDPQGLASAAMWYDYSLEPGASRVFGVAVPFHGLDGPFVGRISAGEGPAIAEKRLAETREIWRNQLDRVSINLPKGAEPLTESIKANLAYILINRDGPAIQPGSRCYDRTWIRDGALTSAALLSLGHAGKVRDFLDWFAPFQYASGKIPCCVDKRGPDPVPENDSHGEYLYAVATYYDYTADDVFLRKHWLHVLHAVDYIELLRNQRMTDEFKSGPSEKRVCYGLLPESISHEGYSAKAMHSYWDDFWTLRGLSDATRIAETLGEKRDAARFAALRDSFRETLLASLKLAMEIKHVDYLPGCAELGDFDATSTTVALWPCGLGDVLPKAAVSATFERYWKFFVDRRDHGGWTNYTPYETRIIGSMVLLGHPERAALMSDFFLAGQRPTEWRSWAEVVWAEPRKQGYIGDMPHTWVGSDFINSMVLMLARRRDADGALIVGPGLPRAWVQAADGVAVKKLRTPLGALSYSARAAASADGKPGRVVFEIGALEKVSDPDIEAARKPSVLLSIPDFGEAVSVEVSLPGEGKGQDAGVDKPQSVQPDADGLVRLPRLPARVEIVYRSK